jgi:lipid-A-disaccharide synthase
MRQFKVVLLPGSRKAELVHHVPILAETARRIEAALMAKFRMVLPNEELMLQAKSLLRDDRQIAVQVGNLDQALVEADLAITKSGTITLECACFGVPAIVIYKTSPLTYFVAKRVVTVEHLAMPNLLAKETLFPEFIQSDATPEKISNAALELLRDEQRLSKIKTKLAQIVSSLGGEGASRRAARVLVQLLMPETAHDTLARQLQP